MNFKECVRKVAQDEASWDVAVTNMAFGIIKILISYKAYLSNNYEPRHSMFFGLFKDTLPTA